MYRSRPLAVAALSLTAALALAACSSGEPGTGPTPFSVAPAGESSSLEASAPAESPSTSPSPTSETTDRGDLKKDIGEVAGIFDEFSSDKTNWMQFKVTNIKAAECTSDYAEPPADGSQLLQIDLEVETQPQMRDVFEQQGLTGMALNFGNDWHAYASNGTTMNSINSIAAFSCLANSDMIPDQIGPAEKAVGSVVFEVSDAQGEIVHRPWILEDGWSWDYDLTTSE